MSDVCEGGCLCGAVTWTLAGKPRFVKECVCESCRRAHGATVVGWVGVRTEQFRLESGATALRWHASSAESERGFCVQCGTRMLFRSVRWPGEIHVTLASIAEPHGLVSTGFSFRDELPAWSVLAQSEL